MCPLKTPPAATVPSCANELMLGKILRGKWGFRGMVTSDSGAVADISGSHHYASNLGNASVLAVSAGCDVESAGSPHARHRSLAHRDRLD